VQSRNSAAGHYYVEQRGTRMTQIGKTIPQMKKRRRPGAVLLFSSASIAFQICGIRIEFLAGVNSG
jgi:hypothetical protein